MNTCIISQGVWLFVCAVQSQALRSDPLLAMCSLVLLLAAVLGCTRAQSSSGLLPCMLSDDMKFASLCDGLVASPSSTVYAGVEVELALQPLAFNGTLHINGSTDAAVFPSTNDYCGPSTISDGASCTGGGYFVGDQGHSVRLVCSGSTLITAGSAVLVLVFPPPYSCSVPVNITWGQGE